MNPARDASGTLGRLVAPLRDRAAEALGRLAPRERMLVLGAGAVTLLLIVWLGVVEPLGESLARLDRDVARSRDDAATIGELVVRYSALRAEVDELEKAAASDQGASLFAQLESIAVPIAGRERIVAMNPSTRAVGNAWQEELVEVRIEGITVRALVSLLHAVESRDPPIAVERLAVKRQYKDQSRVDATVVVSRLRPQ
ncbi:MAG: type II secretion system protein M [Deltaproteobacteria bacterium]|nr:type II secretion system protein M [Deltaproteobacteria bacterium]